MAHRIFTLTNDILSLGEDAFTSLILEFGKTCVLHYTPVYSPCVNCANNPVGNLSGTYDYSGSPINYPMGGVCDLCSGKGQISTEPTEEVLLLLNWEPKTWDKVWEPQLTRIPDAILQAKGFMADMAKMARATYMVADKEMMPYGIDKFVLASPAISPGNIIKRKFFTSIWKRTP